MLAGCLSGGVDFPRPTTPSPDPPTATPLPTDPAPTQTVTRTDCGELIPETTRRRVRHNVDQGLNTGIVVGFVSPCGREVYAYGSKTLAGGEAVDEKTLFEIGSIGKPFTALLLAEMVERGELSFNDPIEEFLPGSLKVPVFNGQAIKLIDLATHTSGLPVIPDNLAPADENNPYADYSIEQMYSALERSSLRSNPGEHYEYSNLGQGLLGHILSLVSGKSY